MWPIRPDGTEGCWRWEKSTYDKRKSEIQWVKNKTLGWQPYVKQFYKERATKPPSTVWLHSEVGHNHGAVEDLKEIMGIGAFDNPKPVSLIKYLLTLATDADSIVLDSFAGSGTTGQAVLELNSEDGGNRKFVLVETEEYAGTLTAERVRRVVDGVPNSKNKLIQDGLEGSFSFFDLGPSIDMKALLSGETELMPSYLDLARYLFYTSTGEEFVPEKMDETKNYIGESRHHHVYLFYKTELEYLKNTALTLEMVRALPKIDDKGSLVFAPMAFVDSEYLEQYKVKFVRLPFEIYRFPSS